ncbi:MAG: hypothetical protein WKF97_08565 [Chitinophagaceae bacterium]
MFPDIPFLYVFGPAIVLVAIIEIIYKLRAKPYKNELEQSLSNFKITVIQLGILLVVLWLSLTPTPSLSTFGYPADLNSVNTNEKILGYLQKSNQAIVRTTEVLKWTLFLFAWSLLASVYGVIKAYKRNNSQESLALK